MRNLVYRVGPKTPSSPYSGHGPKSSGSTCHASEHNYLLSFCHIGTPEAPQEVDIGHLWSNHVNTSQFGVHIGPNLAPYKQYLKPDEARKGYHEPTMSTNSPSKPQGSQNYEGQGQEDTHVFSKSYCNRA